MLDVHGVTRVSETPGTALSAVGAVLVGQRSGSNVSTASSRYPKRRLCTRVEGGRSDADRAAARALLV